VGVLLFSPEHHFLDVELSPSDDRVQRFFGREWDLDLERIRAMKASLQRRLRVEAERFRTLEDLEHFVATRANEIVLTPPRPIAVADPRADLASLFGELVDRTGGGVNGEAPATTGRAASR
jgi:hypothetical protein